MNEDELTQHLEEMVNQHESDREHQLDYGNMPEELLTSYRKEILGFRINSYRTEAAFKLSQNRNDSDFKSITEDLSKDKKNRSIVEAMNRSRNK